jgi:hypothetical protein
MRVEARGRMSQMVMQVSGHIMMDTRTGLRIEMLQNEADCVTVRGDLVWSIAIGIRVRAYVLYRYDYHR